MATPIRMPLMGITMEEGIITRWLVDEGASVARGDVVLEFETDKINAEVEAPADGTLGGIMARAGETVKVQGVCAWVLAAGEAVPLETDNGHQDAPATAREAAPAPTGAPRADSGGRIFASPMARRLARENGIELAAVVGSGPRGRIVADDVRAAIDDQPAAIEVPQPVVSVPAARAPVGVGEQLTGRRRVIAERMLASLQQSAQVTLNTEVDAGELVALRGKLADQYAGELGFKISYNDLLVRICARALDEYPNLQAQLDGERLVNPGSINIGLAIDAEDGLVVPNVKEVGKLQLVAIARSYRQLIDRSRTGSLQLDDLTGGTFTISNLGAMGVDTFTPVLNPPEAAILGVGRIARKPVVDQSGQLAIGSRMGLSLTFDHRINDGAAAARFLQRISQLVEQPFLLI